MSAYRTPGERDDYKLSHWNQLGVSKTCATRCPFCQAVVSGLFVLDAIKNVACFPLRRVRTKEHGECDFGDSHTHQRCRECGGEWIFRVQRAPGEEE